MLILFDMGLASGVKNGHSHSRNRHRPSYAWMNSGCWYREHGLVLLVLRLRAAHGHRFRHRPPHWWCGYWGTSAVRGGLLRPTRTNLTCSFVAPRRNPSLMIRSAPASLYPNQHTARAVTLLAVD